MGGLAIRANIDYLFDHNVETMFGAFVYLYDLIKHDITGNLVVQLDQLGAQEFNSSKIKNESTDVSKLNFKQATKRKIEMGGLVVKAKIDYLFDDEPRILLGAFVFLHDLIKKDKTLVAKFDKLGKEKYD